MPCWAMPSCIVVMWVMLSFAMPCWAMPPCIVVMCLTLPLSTPCHAPSCIVVMCLVLPPLLPPRLLPSHSTGRPVDCPLWECTALLSLTQWLLRSQCRYVVPDSQVPAQSQHWQASVLTTAETFSMSQPHAFLLMSHSRPVGQAIAREAKGTYLSCLPPSGVVLDPISQQWFPLGN
jgi:hypothetical protein